MEKSESSTLEYKRQIPDDHIKFLKTVVAFANGRGGQIIFGIDDETHEVVGIESDNLFKTADSISNMIYDNCIPQIMCEVSLQTLQNKTVIVAQVYPGEHTPYFIKSLGLEQGCFVRVSATTRLADRETVKALMFEGSNIGFDRIIQRKKFVTEKEVRSFCKSLKNTALKNCETDEQKRCCSPQLS
ncbi:ATP-binding protein [bacterium]|nr:ATP-binding protein [bacterium]